MLRKTKIISTLGPATASAEAQRSLMTAGARIFRMNMSHAPFDVCRQQAPQLRSIAAELEIDIGVLMDLQGPSIRTGDLAHAFLLNVGDKVEITLPGIAATLPLSTSVNYPGLSADVKVGATIVIDNGTMLFKILSKDHERVICEVVAGGTLGSRRHINLPGTRVNLPALTEKDLNCIQLAAEIGCDFVAMSFVRDAAHVRELRHKLQEAGSHARIVAKIEDQSAVQNIDEIILESDAIMVARGDLGMEVPAEELPIIQRKIVAKCQRLGRPVIVATHMLESMIENPMPTRAEMTDVANAVYEQADAIMLSGETSTGKYPTRCVEMLARIALRVEQEQPDFDLTDRIALKTDKQKIVKAAVSLANSIEGAKILVFTQRGIMAQTAAHFRPSEAPIFAFAPTITVARSLHLHRAVIPFQLDFHRDDPHSTVEGAIRILRAQHLIRTGDPMVIISDVLQGEFVMDSVLLRRV